MDQDRFGCEGTLQVLERGFGSIIPLEGNIFLEQAGDGTGSRGEPLNESPVEIRKASPWFSLKRIIILVTL